MLRDAEERDSVDRQNIRVEIRKSERVESRKRLYTLVADAVPEVVSYRALNEEVLS